MFDLNRHTYSGLLWENSCFRFWWLIYWQEHYEPLAALVLKIISRPQTWCSGPLLTSQPLLSCQCVYIWSSTAAEVHAHASSVPAPQQPSVQRASFSNGQEASRQHVCFPVSQIRANVRVLNYHTDVWSSDTFCFQRVPHWKLALHFEEGPAQRLLHKITGKIWKRKWTDISEDANISFSTKIFSSKLRMCPFLKLHGAAYGKGIYLSPISNISFGYSGKNPFHKTNDSLCSD